MPTGIYKRTTWHLSCLPNKKGCRLSKKIVKHMRIGQQKRFANFVKRQQALLALHSREAREKRSQSMRGHKFSKNHGNRISKMLKRYYLDPSNREKLSEAHRTPKALKRSRDSHLGKRLSKKTCRKLSIAAMSRVVPFKDTGIELAVQAWLRKLHISFLPHREISGARRLGLFHLFDIIVVRKKLAIEVDGCYWHACPKCFPQAPILRKKSRARDHRIDRLVSSKLGWQVLRIPEHDIKEGLEGWGKLAKKMRRYLP